MTTSLSQDELLALPSIVNVETAARAVGCGRTLAYELVRSGEFPCRVLRIGRKWVVPTADLRRVLGVADALPSNNGADEPANQ